MQKDNFIRECFYNSKTLTILFEESMCIDGKNSILIPNNYCILKNNNYISLNDLVTSIYCYDTFFVSFNLKEKAYNILKQYSNLRCGVIELQEIKYITTSSGIIQNIGLTTSLEERTQKLSLNNCYSFTDDGFFVKLISYDILPFFDVYADDFYIKVNSKNFLPSKIEKINSNELLLIFDRKFVFNPLDEINLYTISTPHSTDSLDNTIKGNSTMKVENKLKTEIKNISVTSYIDNTLTLSLEFTSNIVRYDSKDFKVYINDVFFQSKGHASYVNGFIELVLENIYNLDLEKDCIYVKTSNVSYPYTIDFRRIPILNFSKKIANHFIVISGSLYIATTLLKLNLNFNSPIESLNLYNLDVNVFISDDQNVISFIVDKIGTLKLYGSYLSIGTIKNISASIKTNVNTNLAEIYISSSSDFIIKNIDKIDYIDFSPNKLIRSSEGILSLTTFEAPIELSKIITNPIPGQVIDYDAEIVIYNSESYGNTDSKTIFYKNLYINLNENLQNKLVFELINIEVKGTIYINSISSQSITIKATNSIYKDIIYL